LIYASARNGWAVKDRNSSVKENVDDLFNAIVSHIPHPKVELNSDLRMLISQTESNKYFGKMLIGRILSGKIAVGDRVQAVDSNGVTVEQAKVIKIIKKFGMN